MKRIKKSLLLLATALMTVSVSAGLGKYNANPALAALSTSYSTSRDSYYSDINTSNKDTLLGQLHDLMINTHLTYSKYDDCKDADVVSNTDPGSGPAYVKDFYTQHDISKEWGFGAVGTWNREHVWCQSLSIDTETGVQLWGTRGGGSDLHHIRPIEYTLNSKRNNTPYGEVVVEKSGIKAYSKKDINNFNKDALGGYLDSSNNIFEPIDTVKGDVARILFYTYTHYSSYKYIGGNSDGESTLCDTFGRLAITNIVNTPEKTEESAWKMLLKWNALDPVSAAELTRNEQVAKYQGNRNPFIDHPEYADYIWSDESLDKTYKIDKIIPKSDIIETNRVLGISGTKYVVNSSLNSTNNLVEINNSNPIYSLNNDTFIKQIKVTFDASKDSSGDVKVICSNTDFALGSRDASKDVIVGTIVKASNGLLNINNNYKYVYITSTSGDVYLDDISFTWGDMNLSNETEETRTKVNLAVNYNIKREFIPQYMRLTKNPADNDFTGKYLIVSSWNFKGFDCSDEDNFNKGGKEYEIPVNATMVKTTDDLKKYEFEIAKVNDKYTIKALYCNTYIGSKGPDYEIAVSSEITEQNKELYLHDISIDESGNAQIARGEYFLQYYPNKDNSFFRYYQLQRPVLLYKYDETYYEDEFKANRVALNFGAIMPFADYSKLLSNYNVTGFGVFAALQSSLKGKTIREIYRESNESVTSMTWMGDDIKHSARVIVDSEANLPAVTRTNADGLEEISDGNYVTWKAQVNISEAIFNKNIAAVAYMIVDNEYVFFDQRNISVSSIASAYLEENENTDYAGVLDYLVGFDVYEE